MGSASFAVPALEALAEHICLVVSQPDQPSGRGMQLKPMPVKARALELGLPVVTPVKSRSAESVDMIRALEADVLVVAAYGQILSEPLLNSAKRGGVNLHGSLLPRWRGAAPIQRAIEAGDEYTGVTLMQMDKGLDTGDMIAKEIISISPNETAGELFPRLAQAAANLAVGWMPQIVAGDYPREKQDDAASTHAAKVTKAEAELTCHMTAGEAFNKFRAFTPAPGAWIQTPKGNLRVLKARLVKGIDVAAGRLASVKPELIVGFAQGALCLDLVQSEGRKPTSGTDFANGARLGVGDSLFLTGG
jgi:methionyl-tRNA formyltransferase